MPDLKIISAHQTPADISFQGFLFNEPGQIELQSSVSRFTYYLYTDNSNTASARCTFFLNNGEALSPLRAPFGSIEFDPATSFDDLDFFVSGINRHLQSTGIRRIKIISYPYCYDPVNSPLLTHILRKNDYEISVMDMNFHMDTSFTSFEEGLHHSELRRLNKCRKQGFRFTLENSPDFNEIFSLIRINREAKGHPVTVKQDLLKKLFRTFPGIYEVFSLRDGEKLIASAIGVRVAPNILYNFLPADDPDYKTFSPVVMLMKEMFEYCKRKRIAIFDLGIATDQGAPNFGLIRFKKNLGGISSLKLTFEKKRQ